MFRHMYDGDPEQKCIYCDKNGEYDGWVSLCDATCYNRLRHLLESYETGKVSVPDKRIVNYFTKHHTPEHRFVYTKLKSFIETTL